MGRLRFHPPREVFILRLKNGLKSEREAAFERLCVAFSHKLVAGGTALLLRALRGQQVTEAGRATHKLTCRGEFEALGH